MAKHQVMINL